MAKVKGESLDKLGTGSSTPLGVTILEKLSSLEDLLKKRDDRPLTFKEACTYLGYAPSYLYKLTYKNVIPHYKPTGKMIFFSKCELDEWVFKSNAKLRIENAELHDANNVEKDPNQLEMELKSEDTSTSLSASSEKDASTIYSLRSGHGSVHELLIEFPLKSRQKK